MRYISPKAYAADKPVTDRHVRNLCARGEIPGAIKLGKRWCIPEDAVPAGAGRVAARRT